MSKKAPAEKVLGFIMFASVFIGFEQKQDKSAPMEREKPVFLNFVSNGSRISPAYALPESEM